MCSLYDCVKCGLYSYTVGFFFLSLFCKTIISAEDLQPGDFAVLIACGRKMCWRPNELTVYSLGCSEGIKKR